MSHSASNKKVANSLVALSSAAIVAVYTAGYIRTRPAADQAARQAVERRTPARTIAAIETRIANIPRAAPAVLETPSPSTPSATPALNRKASAPPSAASSAQAAPPAEPLPAAASSDTNSTAPAETPAPPPPTVALTPPSADPLPAAAEAKPAESKVEPVAPAAAPAATVWKDGTYSGWGSCRHGEIEAAVVIAGGRIVSAKITDCRTRYSCDVIDTLLPQVAQRQSPDVDSVSGATQSADAFYYAVVEALSKAK